MPYKDRETQRAYQRGWVARRRDEYLAGKSCEHEGCTARDLEIHHRDPTQKVSHRIWSWSVERRDAELAKCQVLCGAHHQEATRAQRHTRVCAQGHVMTSRNTYVHPTKNIRKCRKCRRDGAARRRALKRGSRP